MDYFKEKASEGIRRLKKLQEPPSDANWYERSASACEDVVDSMLGEISGTSSKITKALAGKLGFAGTSVGIFSIASLLGTASTGTAIGTLSGAAFTSASLAWLGGSVMMGSVIIGVASIAGGIGAVLGAGWVFRKYVFGPKKEKSELLIKEQNIIDVCLSLATAFRQEAEAGQPIEPIIAKALYADALQPLCEDLLDYKIKTESWTYIARKRFESSLGKLQTATNYLHDIATKHPNVTIGMSTAVILQLLSGNTSSFNHNENLVIEAIRRSNSKYTDASIEELSEYVQSLEPKALAGLHSNVKGIYHEFRFVDKENNDGDEYIAEIFEATNYPGADVIITNATTGMSQEIQLKATEYLSYVRKHNDRYENIDVFATSEVADNNSNISDSGFTNDGLNKDVDSVMEGLGDAPDSVVASSMTIAAMISLAKNAKVLLRSESLGKQEKETMIKDASIAAGVAGLFGLLVG